VAVAFEEGARRQVVGVAGHDVPRYGFPSRGPTRASCSAKTWKSGLFLTGVTGNSPLGPSYPRRVPCPPGDEERRDFASRSSCSRGRSRRRRAAPVPPPGGADTCSPAGCSSGSQSATCVARASRPAHRSHRGPTQGAVGGDCPFRSSRAGRRSAGPAADRSRRGILSKSLDWKLP
jgi:hypothetical protein